MPQKKDNLLIEHSVDFLSSIAEQVSDSIIVTATDFKIIYVNKAFQNLFGFSRKEVYGKTPDFLNAETSAREIQKEIYKSVSCGKTWRGTLQNRKKDNSTFTCDLKVTPLYDVDGKVTAYIGLQRDITGRVKAEQALKESEEKFRNLAEQCPNIVFINKRGKVVYANKKCEEIMGYKRDEFYADNFDFMTLIAPESRPLVKKSFELNMQGKEIPPMEYTLLSKSGKKIEAFYTCKLIKYEGEIAILGTIADITERKKGENALKNSKKMIEKEVEQKTKALQIANKKIKEYAKKLDLKIKRIDEKRVPLTEKEKLGFYALVRHPELTITELAKKYGMNTATLNSIKIRLKTEGYFKTMYIPRFDMIGCNLVCASILVGDILSMDRQNLSADFKEKMFDKILSTPEKVYFLTTNKESFTLNIAPDWECFKEMEDSFQTEYQKKGFKFSLNQTILYPMDKSLFREYFNFAGIIKNRFDIKVKDIHDKKVPFKKYTLTTTEKRLVYGLMKYPEYTVLKLSRKIGISVPTICKKRRKLLNQGVINIINIPDFKKIGAELLMILHHKTVSFKDHRECTNPFIFFALCSTTDHLVLGLYRDYKEAQKGIESCYLCTGEDSMEKPTSILIPLDNLQYFKFDFLPLVKKIFNLKIDF